MQHEERLRLLIEDIEEAFKPSRFGMARLPVHVSDSAKPEEMGSLPSCLDMLIMLPGGKINLPEPYSKNAALTGFIENCTGFENWILPGWWESYHLYLTLDTRTVMPGQTHRNAGWHFDGMQGERYPEKVRVCHQYVASTGEPTHYCDLPLDAERLDEMRHNWFLELGRQIPENYTPHVEDVSSIVCMSAYQVHRSPKVTNEQKRTFVRLDVSLKQQDRLGNTLNPDLPAPFEYVERHLPDGLQEPVTDSSWKDQTRYGV